MPYEHLKVDTADYVTTVTLNRPDSLNALNQRMTAELIAALDHAQADEATRVVVLTGAGRGFCAGADLGDIASLGSAGLRPSQMREILVAGSGKLARTLRDLSKPLVAAVNGPCAGAGFGIALACDFLLASREASFGAVFVRRGLVPDYGVTYWLPRLIGLQKARELCLLGDKIGPDVAFDLGLVTKVVDADRLLDDAQVLAARLAAGAGVALGLTRRLLNDSFDQDYATAADREWTAQTLCFSSEDAVEGATSFLEKRPPQFNWR